MTQDFNSILIALVKALLRMISTNENHPQIAVFKARVNVEHEFFGAAGQADWRPRFTLPLRFTRPHVVED